MSFKADPAQTHLLRALQKLELGQCDCATQDGKRAALTVGFGNGVPQIVLQAWVGLAKGPFTLTMESLVRRELVTPLEQRQWPFPGSELRLLTDDGRMILLFWQRATSAAHFARLARLGAPFKEVPPEQTPNRPASEIQPHELGFRIEAWTGRPHGTKLLNASLVPFWSATTTFSAYSITRLGLECLDSLPPEAAPGLNLTFGFVSRPRRPPEDLQGPLLEALRSLEFEGARLRSTALSTIAVQFRFAAGIPTTLVREWLEVLDDDLKNAVRYCERLGFVSVTAGDLIKSLTPSALGAAQRQDERILWRPDGKIVRIVWEPGPDDGLTVVAQSGAIDETGAITGDSFLPSVRANSAEQLLRVTGEGLKWLQERSAQDSSQQVSDAEAAASKPIRALDAYLGQVTIPAFNRFAEDIVRHGSPDGSAIQAVWKDTDARLIAASGVVAPEKAKDAIHRVRETLLRTTNSLSAGIPTLDTPESSVEQFQHELGDALSAIMVARAALRPWYDEPSREKASGNVSDLEEPDESFRLHPTGAFANYFVLDGEFWMLRFFAEDGSIEEPDAFVQKTGFEFIHHMIYTPDLIAKEFPAMSTPSPLTDEQTLGNVREEIDALREQREHADVGEIADLDAQIHEGEAFIKNTTIPGGEIKTFTDPREIALNRFRNNVNRALAYASPKAPHWVAHMRRCITFTTNPYPTYTPPPSVRWIEPSELPE